MKRKSNIIYDALLFGIKKYITISKGKGRKIDKRNFILNSICIYLHKKKFPIKITINDSQTLKHLKLKNGNIISPLKPNYSWENIEPKRQFLFSFFPPYKNLDENNINVYIGSSYIEDPIILDLPNFAMYEIIIFNKKLKNIISISKTIKENILSLRENFLDNPNVSLTSDAFNKKDGEFLGLNVNLFQYENDIILPILDVLFQKVNFFIGIVDSKTAMWISTLCVAAGIKCELKQIYLEDALMEENKNLLNSPYVERALLKPPHVYTYHKGIIEEKDICKSLDVHSYIIPLNYNEEALKWMNTNNFTYLRCYDKQIFKITKEII